MVPVVSLSTILRDIVITVLSFLTHKCPFLIKLNLIGFRGKTLPTHREAPWHFCRQGVNNASHYFYLRQPDALFYALHSFRKHFLFWQQNFERACIALPPEFNPLWDNDLSLIQDIGEDKQKYSIMFRHKEKFRNHGTEGRFCASFQWI